MSDTPSSSEHRLSRASPLVVMKFGGTCVGTAERMGRLVEIVRAASAARRVVVVVSALSGVTRQLDAAYYRAESGVEATGVAAALRERHRAPAAALMDEAATADYAAVADEHLGALAEQLRHVQAGEHTPARRDAILATGEQLTVPMVAHALRHVGIPAEAGDARRLVRTGDEHGAAAVDRAATGRHVRTWHAALSPGAVGVVAGFIGATAQGATTTLGFEGSDYSAALFAALLGAEELVRWTDVDGLYTADPRTHADAERLRRIDLAQAAALNEAGRLGMHPKALRPLLEAGIPARIRCIDAPHAPGTRILVKRET